MPKKVAKQPKSDVVFSITPDTDVEFEWDQVQIDIRKIEMNGLAWAPDFILQDFVFGLKKLIVVCQITDSKIPSTVPIIAELQKINGTGEIEMVSIETAGADWAQNALDKENAEKAAESKDEEKVDGSKPLSKNQQKKAAKAAKKAAELAAENKVREVTAEMLKQDATKVAVSCKESDCFVAGVAFSDGSGASDLTVEQLQTIMDQVRAKVPGVVLMLVTCGKTRVGALVSVPADKADKVNAAEWINSTQLSEVGAGPNSAIVSYGEKLCAEEGQFPIKIKDQIMSEAFSFLKKNNLLEDDSDDDVAYGDDFFLE